MRRSLIVVLLGALALGAGLMLTRHPGEVAAVLLVRKRIGVADDPAVQPTVSAEKIKLGSSTRSAIRAAGASSFTVPIDPSTAAVVFSTGVRAGPPASVRFAVSLGVHDAWQPIFSDIVEQAHQGRWRDHVLQLSGRTDSASRLRFETSIQGQGATMDDAAYWGAIALVGRSTGAPAPRAPLNVILISIDTLNADRLGCFDGVPGVSPHIDDFLAHAVSFRRAYSQYPNTLVSHASMLTGLYPLHHGTYDSDPFVRARTLASILAEHGYFTVAFTEDAYVGSDFGFDQGFDWFDNGPATSTEEVKGNGEATFENAAAWIDQHGSGAPFFLFVHTYEVHTPYLIRDAEARAVAERIDPGYEGRFKDLYGAGLFELGHNLGNAPLPAGDVAHLPALYAAGINYTDRILASFLTHVRSLPLEGHTVIILTSDHGEEFGEHGKLGHGETLFNPVLHVPLGFLVPGVEPRQISDMPVQLIDIMPTILDLVGIRSPVAVDGESLVPLLHGEPAGGQSSLAFAELRSIPFAAQLAEQGKCSQLGLPPDCGVERQAVQNARFKLIRSRFPAYEALYDLAHDRAETRDVADQFPADLAALRAALDAYQRGTTSRKPAPASTIDAGTRERLHALGYQ